MLSFCCAPDKEIRPRIDCMDTDLDWCSVGIRVLSKGFCSLLIRWRKGGLAPPPCGVPRFEGAFVSLQVESEPVLKLGWLLFEPLERIDRRDGDGAVSEAGGVTVFAKRSSTKIVRGEIVRPEVISADLKKLVEQGDISQNVMLANGDLVYVPRSFIGDVNRFIKQITPLMRMILYPAQVINEYGRAGEWLEFGELP